MKIIPIIIVIFAALLLFSLFTFKITKILAILTININKMTLRDTISLMNTYSAFSLADFSFFGEWESPYSNELSASVDTLEINYTVGQSNITTDLMVTHTLFAQPSGWPGFEVKIPKKGISGTGFGSDLWKARPYMFKKAPLLKGGAIKRVELGSPGSNKVIEYFFLVCLRGWSYRELPFGSKIQISKISDNILEVNDVPYPVGESGCLVGSVNKCSRERITNQIIYRTHTELIGNKEITFIDIECKS